MSEAIRIGLVGCGRLAEGGYVPAVVRARGLEIVAVATRIRPGAGSSATPSACRRSARHRDGPGLIAGSGPDAIVIASPAPTHVEAASAAAAAGLPALVEKPPAAGRRRGARAARASTRRPGSPSTAASRSAASSPRPGARRAPPALVEGLLHYRRRSWNPIGDLGDAWLDLGPHLLDLARCSPEPAPARGAGLEVVDARLEPSSAEVELGAPRMPGRDQLRDRPPAPRAAADRGGGAAARSSTSATAASAA